jgi:hypothetical protein
MSVSGVYIMLKKEIVMGYVRTPSWSLSREIWTKPLRMAARIAGSLAAKETRLLYQLATRKNY